MRKTLLRVGAATALAVGASSIVAPPAQAIGACQTSLGGITSYSVKCRSFDPTDGYVAYGTCSNGVYLRTGLTLVGLIPNTYGPNATISCAGNGYLAKWGYQTYS